MAGVARGLFSALGGKSALLGAGLGAAAGVGWSLHRRHDDGPRRIYHANRQGEHLYWLTPPERGWQEHAKAGLKGAALGAGAASFGRGFSEGFHRGQEFRRARSWPQGGGNPPPRAPRGLLYEGEVIGRPVRTVYVEPLERPAPLRRIRGLLTEGELGQFKERLAQHTRKKGTTFVRGLLSEHKEKE